MNYLYSIWFWVVLMTYCREKDTDIAFAQDAIDEYKVIVIFHIQICMDAYISRWTFPFLLNIYILTYSYPCWSLPCILILVALYCLISWDNFWNFISASLYNLFSSFLNRTYFPTLFAIFSCLGHISLLIFKPISFGRKRN